MGMGATNREERVLASLGKLREATVSFAPCADVPNGGVLWAVPFLLASGLFYRTDKHFALPDGYYGVTSLLLLLAFMALARFKAIESLRYCAPGEWGKILGLDRIPEVRTLRQKVQMLSAGGTTGEWGAELCQEWMQANPESAGFLYIDGHVRVYFGEQTKLPRHYVARERLCMRAVTEYWVNARDGQPFFFVTAAVDPGLLAMIRTEVLPRLEEDVPNQLSLPELMEEPLRHRFTLIFDREGYSPEFFAEMRARRIACVTYHKYPQGEWSEDEFVKQAVPLSYGDEVTMMLAERGTRLGNGLWVREIRKLCAGGHQTAVLSTDYLSDSTAVAGAMFARWSQENFFRYMRQQYNLDRLIDYKTKDIAGTRRVVNPAYRALDTEVRKKTAVLSRRLALFGAMELAEEIEPKRVESYQQKKATLQDEIEHLSTEVAIVKGKRKKERRHITVNELPEEERFTLLSQDSKQFIDTIKMIAYRAETAMVNLFREKMARWDDARNLVKALYQSEIDLIPDQAKGCLTVCLHPLANRANDNAISHLCDEINAAEVNFPGSHLRLVYKMGSAHYP